MKAAFLGLCDAVAAVSRWAAVVMAMVMMAALIAQIFFRYVIGRALTGSEELALLMFAWIVLLLASVGVREGFHVRLTAAVAWLPAPARASLDRIILAAVAVFGLFVAIGGWSYVDETRGQVSAATGYPIELLHASAFVCGTLIALQAVGRLVAGDDVPTVRVDPT